MNTENPRLSRTAATPATEVDIPAITPVEVCEAMARAKPGKAVGPDDIPAEAWKCLGYHAVDFLTTLFQSILEGAPMPDEWRRSVLVPLYKNKGDAQVCGNYRGIKLTSHALKLFERLVDKRIRGSCSVSEQQFGFMPGRSTMDPLFALRISAGKYREMQRDLHCVFIDLEKAYDRVPRDEVWHCLREKGVPEAYVRVVQDMYRGSTTEVRTSVGNTAPFSVDVGLHQGSALSPFLFAVVMDQITAPLRREAPWNMLFADDIALLNDTRADSERELAKGSRGKRSEGKPNKD